MDLGAAQALHTKGGSSVVQGDEEVRKTVFAQPSKHVAIKSALLMLSRENPQKLEPHVRLASEQQRPQEANNLCGPHLDTPSKTRTLLCPQLESEQGQMDTASNGGVCWRCQGISGKWPTCNQVQSREMTENGDGIEEKS